MAHGHPLQRTVGAHHHGVTYSLLEHRDDLAAEVEPAEDLIRQSADLVEGRVAAALRILREERVRAPRDRPCLLGGQDGERPGPEAVLLIEAEVLGAVSEREEPGLTDVPAREGLENGAEQSAADATIPEVGMDAERAEEAERPPAGGEHRSHDVAVELGGPGALGRRTEPRAHAVAVTERGARIGQAANRPERKPQHPVRGVEVVGAHGPDVHGALERHVSQDAAAGRRSNVEPGRCSRS